MANLSSKGTLLIVSGPRHDVDRKHLFVICTDPDGDGLQLIVSICSVPQDGSPYDTTCILQPHEHAFLRKPSYIFYARAQLVKRAALEKGVRLVEMITKEDMNGQAFLKVTSGLCRSPQTPRKIKRYYEGVKLRRT